MFLTCLILVAAQPADAPKAVVQRAIQAANLPDPAEVKGHTYRDVGTLTLAGTKAEYKARWTVRFPDAYRFDLSTEIMGAKLDMTVVVNGDKGFESAGGQTQDLAGEKLNYCTGETYQLWVVSLVPLTTDPGFTLSAGGESEVNGKKATGVKVERKGRESITLYFDRETGCLVKTATRVKDEFQNWKLVPEEVTYGDYKDFAGRKVYTTIAVVRDGKTMIESTLSGHEFPKAVDAKLFEKK